jgi:hypothetical protein
MAASRHWVIELHFQKGLAGAPDEVRQAALDTPINPAAADAFALAIVAESNYFQPDWQSAYWGTNYSRLRSIKQRYDPAGLFFVRHGVGGEDWSEDGFIRTRVDGVP